MNHRLYHPKSSNSEKSLLAALILFAAFLRFQGIQWGLPHHLHSDEDVMMYWAEQIRTTDSIQRLSNHQYFFVYSPLPLYWTAMMGYLTNSYWYSLHPEDPKSITILYTSGRVFSAVLGTGTVLIIYLIGNCIGGPFLAFISAFLAAVVPIHIRESHFFTAEVPFTFFYSLFLLFSLKLMSKPTIKTGNICGICLAFIMLCKYTAIAYFPVLCLVQILTVRKFLKTRMSQLKIVCFFLCPYILSGLIFFSFDPWILLNPERFASTYLMLKKWSSGSARPLWTAQFTGLPKGLYWFTSLIPTGFGIPMFIASIAGLVTSFFYRTRIMIPIIASGFLYWLMLGFSFMQYIRYTVPLCPVITILAGAGLFRAVVPSQNEKSIPPIIVAGRIATIFTMVYTGFYGFAYAKLFLAPNTQLNAGLWLMENHPEGTRVLTDNSAYSPPLGSQLLYPHLNKNFVIRGDPDHEYSDYFHIRLLDVYNYLFMPELTPNQRKNYILNQLDTMDLIVFSEEAVVQYSRLRSLYPEVNSFYDELFEGRLGFQLVKEFKMSPRLGPFLWDDSDAELTWRLFDHPRIWIFQRKE